jgi:hypothetical protein
MAVNNLNTPGVGIQPSLIDAKGDLLVGTADDAIDRLGVTGTTGAVLTADAGETTGLKWAAAGSVGGLVHIETQTFSAVGAVNFNNVFSADYLRYKIILDAICSDNENVFLRMRASGSDDSTTNHQTQTLLASSTSITGARYSSQTNFYVCDVMDAANARTLSNIEVHNPFAAQFTTTFSYGNYAIQTGGNITLTHFTSVLRTTSSYDGFTLFVGGSENITGTASVYGYGL